MDSLSASGPAGTGIPDCTSRGQGSLGAWALGSVSLAGLAGDGVTGDMTGITTASFSTTTVTNPTAESSTIASTSTTQADFMEPADFTAEEREDLPEASMDSHRMAKPGPTPGLSVALIMEEPPIAFPRAGSRASVGVSTEAEVSTGVEASMAAVAVTGNSIQIPERNG